MDGILNFFRTLGLARVIAMISVAVGLIGFFIFLSLRFNAPQLGILYTDLELAEASEITSRLDQLQVPYQLADNGRSILAPHDELLKLRMNFAAQGIGGTVGYELLDRQDPLGTTSFMQNVTHRRAIEGELAKTISTINSVREARVHLVLPERELFSRNQNEPTASVALRTSGTLNAQQVQSIQYLIASSVPGMSPQKVSIVDQNGTLLARTNDDGQMAMMGTLQDRQVSIENRLRMEIEDLLAKTVGAGRVRAQVAVDLDLEQIRRESEIFDPDNQVIVSQDTTERTESEVERSGNTVSVATNLPDAEQGDGGQAADTQNRNETRELVNFGNSRTRTTLVRESGGIKRISVAVLVDGRYQTSNDGNATYTPRSEDELAQLARLVRTAVGIDEERGDTVEVVNLRFNAPIEQEVIAEGPATFFGFARQDIERIIEIIVLGVVSILVLFLVIRPVLRRVLEAIPAATASARMAELAASEERPALAPPDHRMIAAELAQRAIEGDDEAYERLQQVRREHQESGTPINIETEIDVAQVEGRLKGSAIKKVGEIVNRHPEESAAIIRQWLYAS